MTSLVEFMSNIAHIIIARPTQTKYCVTPCVIVMFLLRLDFVCDCGICKSKTRIVLGQIACGTVRGAG